MLPGCIAARPAGNGGRPRAPPLLFVSAEVLAEWPFALRHAAAAMDWVGEVTVPAIDEETDGIAAVFIREKVMLVPCGGMPSMSRRRAAMAWRHSDVERRAPGEPEQGAAPEQDRLAARAVAAADRDAGATLGGRRGRRGRQRTA